MPHEPVGNMESVIRKLERFELPKNMLLSAYQNILKAQLRYELKLNEKAFSHKDMHKDEVKLLHIRNQKIRRAESYLKESETKQSPELDILKAASIYFHCPVPQTHEYINGETALTFKDEPDLFALTNLVTTLEPLATQKGANPQFVKYFDNLKDKKSQVLLEESLRNSLRHGVIGIKFPKVRVDLLHGNLPKVHISRPNLTGIVRDYVTVGSNVSQYDKQFLKEVLIDDAKSFLVNTKLFKTNYKKSPDVSTKITDLIAKIDRSSYVIGADEINQFLSLTKDHSYFHPDKEITQINKLIEDTSGLNFDSIRTKKAQKKMNTLMFIPSLVSFIGHGVQNHQQFAEWMNHILSQPDHDPLRPLQAINSVVGLGQQFLEHQGDDPTKTALTYLENPDHVRPVASYLLYDYFESLQNFPEKDRERLVGKATDFITEVATRYQLKDDPNHESLVKYFTTVSHDPEMQKLLSYSILPFTVYMAEHEDLAREQLLQKIDDHWFKGEYKEIIPHIEKIVDLFKNYDPDNIKLDYDNPDRIHTPTNTYTIPQEITNKLDNLPENPSFLPLPQFFSEIESSYEQQWHDIYGDKSVPPSPFRSISQDITQEKTAQLINQALNQAFDITPPTTQSGSENSGDSRIHDVAWSFSQENGDWFTDSIISSGLVNMREIYDKIPENDPYRTKFSSGDGLLNYYQDYIHYIKANGNPKDPLPESDLFGYALVKCNGNYSDALKEMTVLYKFLARYDLETGSSNHGQGETNTIESGSQRFFRTKFLEENLPILESISSQTKLLSDPSRILEELPKGLLDQTDSIKSGVFSPLDIGDKDVDLADIWGEPYHRIAALALTTYTTQTPSSIGLAHAFNEFPYQLYGSIFYPSEQGSTKFSEVVLSDMRNIKFADETLPSIQIRSESKNSALPTIFTVESQLNESEFGKIKIINSTTSSVLLDNPANGNAKGTINYRLPILYYGPSNLIKLLAEKGYAPANFSNEFKLDPNTEVSSELLNFFLSSNINISGGFYSLDLYPEADHLKVAQILLDHEISILQTPDNLAEYLRLNLNVPIADITKVLENPDYYSHITDALPSLAKLGLIKSDHPLVKYAIENDPKATLDYYSILSPDDKFTLKKLNPDLYSNLENYAVSNLYEMKYNQLSELSREQLDVYYSFLIHGLRDENKDTVIRGLNFILPYLTEGQLKSVIQNSRLTEKNLSEIFDSGRILYAHENDYPDLPMRLKNIESIISDHPDLLLYLTPALLKENIWNLEKSQEKIDNLIFQNIKNNNFQFLSATYIFSQLQEAGYVPPEELAKQLVETSISLIKSHPKSYYQSGIYTILGHFASPEQFTSVMSYLADLTTDDAHVFTNQLFSERFGQYSSYNEQYAKPINQNEKALMNELLANDKILPFLGGEGGLLGTYYSYADNLTESNAYRLYDINLPDLSEMDRYQLVVDMNKHNFHPPAYVFNHDKFIEQIYVNYTSERFYIFDPSYKDFVKDNLQFSEFLDIFKFISKDKEHGYFDLSLNEGVIKVFNHEYFASIPGYTPELEKELVTNLISQLSTIEKDRIPWESIYFASYLTSQQLDFDYGPYFVAWITDSNIKNIVEDNPTRTKLFIETARQIKSEYWDEIRANDLEKYNYLQNLIASSKESTNNHKN